MALKEHATALLRDAIKDGGDSAIAAERLIDYFGRRGFTEFGELLVN